MLHENVLSWPEEAPVMLFSGGLADLAGKVTGGNDTVLSDLPIDGSGREKQKEQKWNK
ncbi:hypothetical protein [Labrenzia sp. 011]|uniref:hypothetical protein n=1 Tax=Labrenzia sp. 011 TaxID=2171494 RepID=UPI001403C7A3|nr:hypothetical protein [Labrenzia sp. 011]